ncbi:MAG: molybdopterin-dependent oxidoreductase, partial [Deltaproteobacteria bacterium]|nr:molybdopterin-dependent oxidoreductase [Deltaproteobacteria bacterium]
CALCTAHCATVTTVEAGRVIRLDPDAEHPNGGVMCLKGKAAPELLYHPERLNYPLRRSRAKSGPDPGWERVSWDEALDDIAKRLWTIREHHGARAVALAKGTKSGTSVDDVERWLGRFLNAFGSPNWVSTTHICNWHRDTGFSYTFGMNLPTPDVANSKSFLLWGHNPSHTSLILAHDITAAKTRGMKLVGVDPRRVGLMGKADIHLPVRPGADGALALALIHALIEEGWYDADFVRRWTNGSFLLRLDNGLALTEADVSADGRPDRHIAWDERTDRAVTYDCASGSFESDGIRPSLFGARSVRGKDGATIHCLTALMALASLASRYAPERSQAITWVSAEKVWKAAHLLAHHRPVSLYMWNGLGQHTNATQTSRAVGILYALLGDIDQPGGNVVFPKAPVNTVDGKDLLPKEMAAQRIGRAEKPLGPPAKPGNCAAYDIFTAILERHPYPVKALLNFGSNTVISTADSRRAREAFCALEFSVATELFMTPTAELCDYVLPATSFLEMSNLATAFEHRPGGKSHIQYRHAVVPPLAERRSDTWIIFELAKRMGLGDRFWNGDVEAGYAHELAPSGLALEQVKASPGGITLPVTPGYRKYAAVKDQGESRGFATPSKKVEIYSHTFAAHGFSPLPEYVEPAMSPYSRPELAGLYPLVLTNAKFTTFIHSQLRALPSLRRISPEPLAEIHPQTAARYGVKNGDWIWVETPKTSMRVKAKVTDRILPDVVCCQHGWWQQCSELNLPAYNPYSEQGANLSLLIGSDLRDPISGSLPHRSYLCRVRPLYQETVEAVSAST